MTRGRSSASTRDVSFEAAAVGAGAVGRVEVRPVATRRDLNEFLQLPHTIYRDDPVWVPQLRIETKAFLNRRRHPFYLHGDAQPFLARRGDEVVGRILVSDDPRYNQQHDANVGCFGMFESIDDAQVAEALLQTGEDWLRQRGRDEMMGPIDYSTNYLAGLLVEGFDTPPRVMMNHHRPYYQDLLEACGLSKVKDLYAWWFDENNAIDGNWREQVERLKRRMKVTIRPISLADFDAEVERIKHVYHEAWVDSWAFVRMTDAEFRHMADQIRQIAPPELTLLAEVDGEPVGVSVTLPDVNEAIKPLGGRLTTCGVPIGLARLLLNMRRIRHARMVLLGVLKGHRRRGIAEMLILQTFDYGKGVLGYTGAELSWTIEDNHVITHGIQHVGGRHYKTYRIYRKAI